jgi:hypothetical protein
VQKRVARAVGEFDKAEAFLGFEPFDRCLHRRPRGFLETGAAEAGGYAEIARRRLEILVVETAPAPLPKIPVLVQVKCPDLASLVAASWHIFAAGVSADRGASHAFRHSSRTALGACFSGRSARGYEQ